MSQVCERVCVYGGQGEEIGVWGSLSQVTVNLSKPRKGGVIT